MTTQSVLLLANMRPPSYQVQIPTEQVLWYQCAPSLFLALAVLSFGFWFARSRGCRHGIDRAMLIACAGSLWLSYSAWWIWQNREGSINQRDFAAIVAIEMPFLWIQFCMLAFLMTRVYLHRVRRLEAEANNRNPTVSHWRNDVLAILLVLGTAIPVSLAGHHAIFLPLMFICWILAFMAWGVLGLVAWFIGRTADRPTRASAQAEQAAANDGLTPSGMTAPEQ